MESSLLIKSRGLLVAVCYGLCSAGMAFANKALLNVQQYNFPAFIMCCQMIFTILTFEALRLTGVIELEAYSIQRGRSLILASLFYAANCVLALAALSGMNIPMYGAVKRCAPLAILILGVIVLKKDFPSFKVVLAVLLVTSGCILAGYGDLSLDPKAYIFGGGSVLTQAIYLILIQRSNKDNLGPLDTTHINSFNTLPIFLVTAIAIGDIPNALYNFRTDSIIFVCIFALVVCMGCLLNFTLFLCTQFNSALTTSVVGSIKSIGQAAVGAAVFGGISLNVFTISGISINLIGATFYSYVKYKESQQDKT